METSDDEFVPTLDWPGQDRVMDQRPSDSYVDEATIQADSDDKVAQGASVAGPAPLLPAIAGRMETVSSSLASLTMHVTGLASATASLRSLISDRLSEYAEMMSNVGTSQADSIAEYRDGHERALTEIRRSLNTSNEAIKKLAARADALLSESRAQSEIVRSTVSEVHDTSSPDVADALAELHAEVQQLKRRIGVRGRMTVNLDDDQLQAIADAVGAKLGDRAVDDAELERIVEGVVGRLESMIEVVPDNTPPAAPKAEKRSSRRAP